MQLTGAAVLALGILWFFRDNVLSSVGLDKDDLNAVLNGGGSDLAYIMQIAAIVFLVVGSVIILSSIVLCVATCKMDSCCFALVRNMPGFSSIHNIHQLASYHSIVDTK